MKPFIIFSLLCIAFLAACATPVGKTSFPQPSASFVPKRTYPVSPDKMWTTVMNVLEEHRILVASSDKAAGRITTDYIAGVAHVYVGGIGGSSNSRYKYSLSITPAENAATKLTILCALESSYSGSSGNIPFRDVSQEKREFVTTLENWLYQEIEKALPHSETQ